MFFEPERIAAFREMICSDTVEEREAALDKILPYQQSDFEQLYEALEGDPVTIRFLDPPLHEFVPTDDGRDRAARAVEEQEHRGDQSDHRLPARVQPDDGTQRTPSCGHLSGNREDADKGCHPRCSECSEEAPDWKMVPEIMIPLACDAKELKYVRAIVVETADAEIKAAGASLEYKVGTMIEIPRARSDRGRDRESRQTSSASEQTI
jgi:pyruvate,orthophosphate dikinase